jgi:hypothetical protein
MGSRFDSGREGREKEEKAKAKAKETIPQFGQGVDALRCNSAYVH